MFIYNFKVKGGILLRIIIIVLSLFMLGVFGISVYRIFISSGKFVVEDKIEAKDVTEIEGEDYANILQAVHNEPEAYIGMKVRITGYVYRLLDFEENQFVIARDMYINENKTQTVVIGFLSENKNANKFKDGTWVSITGTIQKGKYHNEEIPILKVTDMQEVAKPSNPYVNLPDDTYIPTSGIL